MSAPASQGTNPQQLISNISNTYSSIERGDWVNAGLGMVNTAIPEEEEMKSVNKK